MQKLETELWNHAMVEAGHAACTDRFHELARLVLHLVTTESRMIERYVYGLDSQIHMMVAATEPKTIQKAVQISSALTDEAVRNGSIKKVEKRGNMREPSKDNNSRDDNKRTRTGNAFASTTNPVGRENTEGQSMQRPPLFESDGFIYWKNRFETYVKSKDLDLWHVITDGDFPPIQNNPETKKDEVVPFHKQNDDLKKKLAKNNEAKMACSFMLCDLDFEPLSLSLSSLPSCDLLFLTNMLILLHYLESFKSEFAEVFVFKS
ncbi:hypothetical protein Tco_1058421 [Tanacetum coccineum]|uniref:DUF4219 domain-containing protein n=1 Tax=Tanacetum coccineum TaxID=301880 RepID=A0ABQ5H8Z9_9ASTR